MSVKELIIISSLIVSEYVILLFNWHMPIAIIFAIGIIPAYFILEKMVKNFSKEEYTSDKYTHDIKILGIVTLFSITVFFLLFLQNSLSFTGGFSIGLILVIYSILYIDFLRKKFIVYADYNESHQSLNKGAIALSLYLLYNILYYG